MKVAVYDRFWSTAGGGEKFAGGIAQVLSAEHDVDLLGPEPFDVDELGTHLALDLSRVGLRTIDDDLYGLERASADYDLLVNASYTSREMCRAAHGLYVVHFPGPIGGSRVMSSTMWRSMVAMVGDSDHAVEMGGGFYAPERMLQRWGTWSGGRSNVRVFLPPGPGRIVVELARLMPSPDVDDVPVTIRCDGAVAAEVTVSRPQRRLARRATAVPLDVEGRGPTSPVEIEVECPAHPSPDGRPLGIAIVGVRTGRGVRARLRAWYPWLVGSRVWAGFLGSYDTVVANSAFTRRHVEQAWGVSAQVLNPPVTMFEPGDKEPIILSVGRFFPVREGHSKKQLEMVEAFERLCERTDGWSLHLVGGVDADGRDYLEEVRARAAELPVVVHPNARGPELADLYGRASIYWHATGYGESRRRHPDRFEHFGITTVEAMSAGAVPIVIGEAGQLETVQDGRTGYHWSRLDELVDRTAEVAADTSAREAMAMRARQAAQDYSFDAFARRLQAIVVAAETS